MNINTIVCAAIKHLDGHIICGVRHFDLIMVNQIKLSGLDWKTAIQGFVDSKGNFLTRDEALEVVKQNKQPLRFPADKYDTLYSENLY